MANDLEGVSITRYFNVILNEATIEEDFSLNNLTGSGRVDVVCRIISSTFFLSNAFRKNTELNLLFKKSSQKLSIAGNKVCGINPDERAIAGILARVFSGKPYKGIYLTDIDWNDTLSLLKGYLLVEDGPEFQLDSKSIEFPVIFTLGDHRGFKNDDLEILVSNSNLQPVSLGKYSYLSSSCITIAHYLIDKKKKDVETEKVF